MPHKKKQPKPKKSEEDESKQAVIDIGQIVAEYSANESDEVFLEAASFEGKVAFMITVNENVLALDILSSLEEVFLFVQQLIPSRNQKIRIFLISFSNYLGYFLNCHAYPSL